MRLYQSWEDDATSVEYNVALDQTIRLGPNDAAAYNKKGYMLIKLLRYEESLVVLDQAMRLDPNDAATYFNKSYALQHMNRENEAKDAFKKAKELGYEGG